MQESKPPSTPPTPRAAFKQRIWEIVFEAETPAGKLFDVALLWLIGTSVLVVMLESVKPFRDQHHDFLIVAEWFFTIIFTLEYILRIWLVRRPWRYIFSFYGIVDLLSCLPGYIALSFDPRGSHFAIIRILRLLRMFRVLKMVGHVRGANTIMRGLAASRAKITVFFTAVLFFAVLAGTLIYLVESEANEKFSSIPISIYYAIVSITTVGYGDIYAITPLGQLLSALMVLTGYAIIAVPTGIVAGDMVREVMREDETTDACPGCGVHGHLRDASYCRKCGEHLDL